MAGQALVMIKDKQWAVDIAVTPWELSQGLGGLLKLPLGTGMLFDLEYEQVIEVTTVPMLFPLDIAFLSEDLTVSEIYHDIEPGYIVTSQVPARYFLEVNAGEMVNVEPGDTVSLELLAMQSEPVVTNWMTPMAAFTGIVLIGALAADVAKSLSKEAPNESNRKQYISKAEAGTCEIVRPRHYSLVSWFNAPVPDYSFAIEPETKERKIDEVLRRLKSGVDSIQESDHFREFLLTMSKFHEYSIGNLMLIMLQKPDATRVAGFTTWKNLGRFVKKGEKGIAILAPCMPPKQTKVVEPEDEANDEGLIEIRPIYFKVVHVFDLSQTEGRELPDVEVPVLTGEANTNLFEGALSVVKAQGVNVNFESRPHQAPAIKGMYSGKTIWVRPEESRAQQLKTLLHEMGHYYSEGVFRMPRRNAETIAESVAFTVGAHFGFDSGTRSFPYVALWAQDKKVLEQNLADIRRVSTKIIDALEPKVSKVGVAA